MPHKKRKHHKKTTHRRKQQTFTKATADTMKLAVTGLVGAGVIASTGTALRNLTGK